MALTKAKNRMIDGAMLNVLDFMPDGTATNTTDVTTYFQNAIDEASTSRKALYVPVNAYLISSTLKCYANTVIVGERGTRNFGSKIYWADNATSASILFDINGDLPDYGNSPDSNPYTHQVHIENITVEHNSASSPDFADVIRVRKAYNIILRGLRLHNIRGTNCINIESEANDIQIEDCIVYGFDGTGKPQNGLLCNGDNWSTVVVRNCDFEVLVDGVHISDGRVQLHQCFFERNLQSIRVDVPVTPDEHKILISGCAVAMGSSSETGIYLYKGSSTTVADCSFNLTGTAIATNALYVDNINTTYWQDSIIRGVSSRWIGGAGKNRLAKEQFPGTLANNDINRFVYYSAKTLADNTATTMFTFGDINSGGAIRAMACKLKIWATKANFGKSYQEYAFLVTQATDIDVSGITQIFDETDNTASANWTITLAGTVNDAGTTVEIKATANTGGSLGEGTDNEVYAELEILTTASYPNVTIN